MRVRWLRDDSTTASAASSAAATAAAVPLWSPLPMLLVVLPLVQIDGGRVEEVLLVLLVAI